MLSPSSRQDSQSCSGLCCKNTVAGGDDQDIRLTELFQAHGSCPPQLWSACCHKGGVSRQGRALYHLTLSGAQAEGHGSQEGLHTVSTVHIASCALLPRHFRQAFHNHCRARPTECQRRRRSVLFAWRQKPWLPGRAPEGVRRQPGCACGNVRCANR